MNNGFLGFLGFQGFLGFHLGTFFEVLVPSSFQKIYHMLGLSDNLTNTVFVYLCVFVYLDLCIWVSDTWEHCF